MMRKIKTNTFNCRIRKRKKFYKWKGSFKNNKNSMPSNMRQKKISYNRKPPIALKHRRKRSSQKKKMIVAVAMKKLTKKGVL